MTDIATDGSLSLLPQSPQSRPLFQFWRRHRDLLDEAKCLRTQIETVAGLCERLVDYLSTDLHWVTRDGVQPVAFEALAAGLVSYRDSRASQFARKPFSTSGQPYRAFVDTVLRLAAARLSMVRLASTDAMWSPASGRPLQPWLDAQPKGVVLHPLPFDQQHADRIQKAMSIFVLDEHDRRAHLESIS